ncbi:hypothetical protein BH11MYX1_BH11MYX1_30810 [soil metagenome]
MNRIATLFALSTLASCSLLSKAGIGDKKPAISNDQTAASDVPRVAADDGDSGQVQQTVESLNKLEAKLVAKSWADYADHSKQLNIDLVFRKQLKDEKKYGALIQRLAALDSAAYKSFGGRLFAAVGTGARAVELDDEGNEARAAVIKACGSGDVAKYEEAIARAKKINPNSLHMVGSRDGHLVDMPNDLMQCELGFADDHKRSIEEYQPETMTEEQRLKQTTMCGKIEWQADGIQIGSGRFAPYTRTEGGASFPEEVPCSKFPKKNQFSAGLAAAVKEFLDRDELKKAVTVTVGAPTFETDQSDFHVHRIQLLATYSNEFKQSVNPCGAGKVFCEAGGSKTAGFYNRAEHDLERAAANAGKDPELCRKQLTDAKAQYAEFVAQKTQLQKSGGWIAGAVYKTKKGIKMKEKELITDFDAKGKLADERLLDKYCKAAAK